MATVGQALTAPEAGWKRYEQDNQNITLEGNWTTESPSGISGGTQIHANDSNTSVKFNFVGTKLRIIGSKWTNRPDIGAIVLIDGVQRGAISQKDTVSIAQTLDFEILGIENQEHYVVIKTCNVTDYSSTYVFDAIDIDENGELKPYNPTPSGSDQAILRITMNDSSEREYKVSKAIADDFVTWCNRTIGTGNSAMYLTRVFKIAKSIYFTKKSSALK